MVSSFVLESIIAEAELATEAEDQLSDSFDDVDEAEGSLPTESEQEFREAALQVIVQRNDFLLPNLIDMFATHRSLEIAPYYQRRARWDNVRRSRLIESFLINIPVPPVFLYENDFARYEVMDGQQRVTAIFDYFNNKFPLRQLEMLTSLNGKRFTDLPRQIRAGLERRSLSAIILLKESAPSPEAIAQLRRHVFERLNTGGVRLNAQEVRNCVHAGKFNSLLLELSRHELFTTMWNIPAFEPDEMTEPSEKLLRNAWYRSMRDVELVLRVFALKDPCNVAGGMKRTLDDSMAKYSECSDSELTHLKNQFLLALRLAYVIGGNDTFRLPSVSSEPGRLSAPLFDGIMVALIRKLDQSDRIESCAAQIRDMLQAELDNPEFYELVTGRANTREATLERSSRIEYLIENVTGA